VDAEAEAETCARYRRALKPGQLAILGWIAEGCPEDRYQGYSHRISAAALQTRGLVKVTGRGSSWKAELTERGAAVAELPDAVERVAGSTSSTKRKPSLAPERLARAPSKAEKLIADLVAAGGVLRVPYWREDGQPNYRQRATAAQRYRKVPPGKRLVMERVLGGELEIRLEDALPDADVAGQPVPVPRRLSRPHPIAARYRDDSDQHLVSRSMLARSIRIIHALATEAERRGHQVANPNVPARYRSARSSAKEAVPHLVITVGNHAYSLSITEEKVTLRGVWEERRRAQEEHRLRYPLYGGYQRLKPYDSEATGRLSISLVASGHRREGRASVWSDRKSWSLETKLPELLEELTLRVAEDDQLLAEARRKAEDEQRQWQILMERAKERFLEAHRATALRAQIAARREAQVMKAYLAELQVAHGHDPQAAEWIEWVRAFITSIDPLSTPPAMPEEPEITHEALKPFLPKGVSPYGPERR
jgi:hypothetical protein